LYRIGSDRVSRSEEVVLAERTHTLVGGPEPLADAGNVEFVLACLAGHLRQALIGIMDNTVTNAAILDSLYFLVDVALPKQDSSDDVTILDL